MAEIKERIAYYIKEKTPEGVFWEATHSKFGRFELCIKKAKGSENQIILKHPKYGDVSFSTNVNVGDYVQHTIYATLKNIDRLERLGVAEEDIRESYRKIDGLIISNPELKDESDTAMASFEGKTHEIKYYKNKKFNIDIASHELLHCKSGQGRINSEPGQDNIAKSRTFKMLDEAITEGLACEDGKENGYVGYDIFMDYYYKALFRNEDLPVALVTAYLKHDEEGEIQAFAEHFGVSKEFALQYFMKCDVYLMDFTETLFYNTESNAFEADKKHAKVVNAIEAETCFLCLSRLNKLGKEVASADLEEIGKIVYKDNKNITNIQEYILNIVDTVAAKQTGSEESKIPVLNAILTLMDKEGIDKSNVEALIATKIKEFKTFNNEVEDDFDAYSFYKEKYLYQEKIDEDVIYFLMKSMSIETQEQILRDMAANAPDRNYEFAIKVFKHNLLNKNFANKEEKVAQLYRENPKLIIEIAIDSLEKGKIIKKRKDGATIFFNVLNDQEKEYVLAQSCKRAEEFFKNDTLNSHYFDDEMLSKMAVGQTGGKTFFPNKEIAAKFIKTVLNYDVTILLGFETKQNTKGNNIDTIRFDSFELMFKNIFTEEEFENVCLAAIPKEFKEKNNINSMTGFELLHQSNLIDYIYNKKTSRETENEI